MTPTESIPTTLLAMFFALAVIAAAPATAAHSAQSDDQLNMKVEQDGDTVIVTLTSSAQNVAGVETNISFNPDTVQFAEAEGVDLADPVTNHDNENGWVFITQAQADGVDEPTMTKLTFEVVGDGTSNFAYDDAETAVFDGNGDSISVEVSGTSVDVSDSGGSDDGGSDDGSSGGDDGGSSDDSSGDDSSGDDSSGDDSSSSDDGGDDSSGDDSSQQSDNSDESSEMNNENSGDSNGDSGESSDDSSDDDAGSSSSLISGIGLLAVVAGFLFAVAILARGRM